MDMRNKKIGIWGYGIANKSIVRFLSKQNYCINVLEERTLEPEELDHLSSHNIAYFQQNSHLKNFLAEHDLFFVSPGIDTRAYKIDKEKIITELDIFYYYFKKPIIAITGTIGKTTLTQLLAKCLQKQGLQVGIAGNIGIGLCDLIEQQDNLDYAVIEVSSFQLEHCKQFAPQLAIWSNFYPNHLDRHNSLQDYFEAKLNIMRYQNRNEQTLVPLDMVHKIPANRTGYAAAHAQSITPEQLEHITQHYNIPVFCIEENYVVKKYNAQTELLFPLSNFSNTVLVANALITIASLYMLNCSTTLPSDPLSIEHRLEHIAQLNGVTFYNDSKATVMQATLAAVNALLTKSNTLLLFLGGLSKGVDREPLIKKLSGKVVHVFCFGAEAIELARVCRKYALSASEHKRLEEAFAACMNKAKQNDIVLFSPGGSSFDLFDDYQHRGRFFKQLILDESINIPNS